MVRFSLSYLGTAAKELDPWVYAAIIDEIEETNYSEDSYGCRQEIQFNLEKRLEALHNQSPYSFHYAVAKLKLYCLAEEIPKHTNAFWLENYKEKLTRDDKIGYLAEYIKFDTNKWKIFKELLSVLRDNEKEIKEVADYFPLHNYENLPFVSKIDIEAKQLPNDQTTLLIKKFEEQSSWLAYEFKKQSKRYLWILALLVLILFIR